MAHRFIGLQVDVSDEAARLAVRNWVPFLPGVAAARSGFIRPLTHRSLPGVADPELGDEVGAVPGSVRVARHVLIAEAD